MVIMNDKIAEELVRKAVQGNFKYIYKTIQKDKLVLEQDVAVKIIIGCCRVVCAAGETVIKEDDLCQVLIACIPFIQSLEDRLCKPYLQSVYHITAFLLEKEKFECLVKMADLLNPTFINSAKNEAFLDIYISLCMLIYKSIGKIKTALPEDVLITMLLSSLRMFSHCVNIVKLLNIASSYFQNVSFMKADVNLQCLCYSYLWDIVDQTDLVNKNGCINTYKAIVDTLQPMIINLLRKQDFKATKNFVALGLRMLSKLCNKDEYRHLEIIIFGCLPVIHLNQGINANEFVVGLRTSLRDLQHLSTQYKYSPQLQTTCYLSFCIFQELLEYCKSLDADKLSCFMSEEIHLELSKLLQLIAETWSNIKMDCRFCSNCKVKTNLLMSINVHLLNASFLKVAIDKQMFRSDTTYSYVVRSMSKCCVQIIQLRDLRCQQWKSVWLRVRVIIFNSVSKMYQHKNAECIMYGVILINTVLELEYSAKLMIEPVVLCKTLRILSQMMFDNGKLETAAVFAALEILYCDDVENMSFSHWIQIKFPCKDDLKQLTIICVLTKKTDIIKNYFPRLNLIINNTIKIKILLHELAQYKQKWPSRIPMAAVIKELYDIADSFTLAKTVVQTWDGAVLENEEVSKLIPSITEKLRGKKSTVEGDICLALLYVMQYYIKLEELQNKIEDNMKSVKTPPKVVTSPSGVPKNTSDECSLTPYVDLNLEQYFMLSLHLNNALRLITPCFSDSVVNDYELYNTFERVAYEFEKHGDSLQALQAWFVCFQLSKLANNKLVILKSGSFVLKYANMKAETTRILLKDCNDLVSSFASSSDLKVLEVLCQYSVNKGLMLLRHDNVEESLYEYRQALQFFKQIPDDQKDALLKIQLEFLEARYMQLPCDVGVENHENYSLARLFTALKDITSHMKINGGARAIALLLEVNEYLVKMYKQLNFSREIRCYSRSILRFAQQQFLPLRVASTVTFLAYADIISLRFDDTKVKLSCLVDVLSLEESNICTDDNCSTLKEFIDGFSKMVLTCDRIEKDGSPGLLRKPVVLPQFLGHQSDCVCYYCTSIEYKYLVLVYFTLEAHLRVYIYSSESAKGCFEAALQFYRYISTSKDEFEAKITKLFKSYFLMDLQDFLLEAYGTLLLHYGNELLRTEDIEKATCVNTDLINAIGEQKCTNAHLYNAALYQAIMILMEGSTKKQAPKSGPTLLTVSKDVGTGFKTPENNKKKITFAATPGVKSIRRPERYVRKLKFNFSPPETPVQTKTRSFAPNLNAKTPLRCEIKNDIQFQEVVVTSPNTKSSIKPKKSILKEVLNPDDSKNEIVIPCSPNAYTPNAMKVASALKARTTLLTKKVQKSNIKKVLSNDDTENICNKTICKNLIKELSDSEQSNKNEHVKKTTKVRKVKLKTDVPLKKVTRSKNVKK